MNFANYNVNFDSNKYLRNMSEEKFNELKATLRNFIDDTEYMYEAIEKITFNYINKVKGGKPESYKDTVEYQSICRISRFTQDHYKKLLFDDFVQVFSPWGGRPWSLAENFTTFDRKFFIRTMNGFWYCLPIVRYSPGIITVETPDEIAMKGDSIKAYNNRYVCMLGFIVDLAEYVLKTKYALKLKEEK